MNEILENIGLVKSANLVAHRHPDTGSLLLRCHLLSRTCNKTGALKTFYVFSATTFREMGTGDDTVKQDYTPAMLQWDELRRRGEFSGDLRTQHSNNGGDDGDDDGGDEKKEEATTMAAACGFDHERVRQYQMPATEEELREFWGEKEFAERMKKKKKEEPEEEASKQSGFSSGSAPPKIEWDGWTTIPASDPQWVRDNVRDLSGGWADGGWNGALAASPPTAPPPAERPSCCKAARGGEQRQSASAPRYNS